MNELTKATNQLAREQSNVPATLVHKIALLDHKEPLIKNPDEGQKFLCKQIVYIYTALGHTNIFKQAGAEQQIKESALIVFENLKANIRLRHLSSFEIEQAIKKGCSGEFETDEKGRPVEFKHFSPNLMTTWIKLFNAKFTPQVIREKERLEKIKLMEYKDKNQEEFVGNSQSVRALWEFMEKEHPNMIFTDFKQFYGRFIAKVLCTKYPVGEHLVKKYTNRKDLWAKWKKKSREGLRPEMKDFEKLVQQQTMKQYCYEIFDMFKEEFMGDELTLEMFLNTIEEYHNDQQ